MEKRGFSSLVVAAVIALLTLGAVLMIINQGQSVSVLPQSSLPEIKIERIDPDSGRIGSNVMVIGSGFTDMDNTVKFGQSYISGLQSTDTRTIIFSVPEKQNACAPGEQNCASATNTPIMSGEYDVLVMNIHGTSNKVPFAVIPELIGTFEKCVAAGYPIAESKPRQCVTLEGKTFIEETKLSSSPVPQARVKKISTKAGELTLRFADGKTTLSGILFRENPCIDWSIETSMTKDFPPSAVEFHVIKKSTAEICIQVIGKPQEVTAEVQASAKTKYNVFLQEEQVFSGIL